MLLPIMTGPHVAAFMRWCFCLSYDRYLKAVGFEAGEYSADKFSMFNQNPAKGICYLDDIRISGLIEMWLKDEPKYNARKEV